MKRDKACPLCRHHLLDRIEAHGSRAELCLHCRGLWFEAGDLSAAIRAHDPGALPPQPLASSVGAKLGASEDRCPNCEDPLSVYTLSEANPLRVEICAVCSGAWLPHGNLDRALAGHQLPAAEQVIESERTWGNWFLQVLTGLPVEFNVAPRRKPVVTYGLILVTGLIHFALPYVEGLLGISRDALLLDPAQLGALSWFAGLVTSQFLHGSTIHLLGNMYFLWILGDNVEDVLGGARFLLFYLAAGVAAGLVYSFATDPAVPMLGASGAVSGVMALYAVLFRRSKLTFMLVVWQFKLIAPLYVAVWLAFNAAGFVLDSPGVAWEAHLGGFAFGGAVGLAAHRRLLRRRPLLRLLNSGAAPDG